MEDKSLERAKFSVWWPEVTNVIDNFVKYCEF